MIARAHDDATGDSSDARRGDGTTRRGYLAVFGGEQLSDRDRPAEIVRSEF
jgi:hypothetical protein